MVHLDHGKQYGGCKRSDGVLSPVGMYIFRPGRDTRIILIFFGDPPTRAPIPYGLCETGLFIRKNQRCWLRIFEIG